MTEAQAGVHALRGSHTHQLRDGRTQPPLLVLSTLTLSTSPPHTFIITPSPSPPRTLVLSLSRVLSQQKAALPPPDTRPAARRRAMDAALLLALGLLAQLGFQPLAGEPRVLRGAALSRGECSRLRWTGRGAKFGDGQESTQKAGPHSGATHTPASGPSLTPMETVPAAPHCHVQPTQSEAVVTLARHSLAAHGLCPVMPNAPTPRQLGTAGILVALGDQPTGLATHVPALPAAQISSSGPLEAVVPGAEAGSPRGPPAALVTSISTQGSRGAGGRGWAHSEGAVARRLQGFQAVLSGSWLRERWRVSMGVPPGTHWEKWVPDARWFCVAFPGHLHLLGRGWREDKGQTEKRPESRKSALAQSGHPTYCSL
ncbi:hypothetical protein J1605_006919 [Eschrichtius robustus]|uniref:Uncharacterized protein n=1 Tax=Eschrichtius robustus TaxID=9764 RepID=A0AB34H5H2_ESCRO|nr:hypothetical protein J1605_006919 [Eschrichtius robustus]